MKWWFSDYDGTLDVSHSDKLNQDDLDFINKWIQEGNKFIVASGRMDHEIYERLEKNNLECDYIISNNGCLVLDKNKNVLSKLTIPMEIRKDIWTVLDGVKEKYNISYCSGTTRNDFSSVESAGIDADAFIRDCKPQTNMFEKAKDDILNDEELNIIYFFIEENQADEVKELFKDFKELKAINSHKMCIEVIHKDASKAHGMDLIRDIHGFELKDVYASGDSENDKELLQYTPNSFIMSHATNEMKKHASHVIKAVHEIENYIIDFH